jgi:hypothetical protein
MRTTAYAAVLLSICLAGACAKKQPRSEPYVLRGMQEPLSAQDITSAFEVLGLKITRFACAMPEEGRLLISVRRYIHGTEDKALGEHAIPMSAGQQQLTLFTREENQSLSFTLRVGGYGTSWSPISIEGYGAKTWGRLDGGPLQKGKAVPFYAFAANMNGITSFRPDRPLEELTAQYSFVVVFFAELL